MFACLYLPMELSLVGGDGVVSWCAYEMSKQWRQFLKDDIQICLLIGPLQALTSLY